MLSEIFIYGAGGVAKDIISILESCNCKIKINIVVTTKEEEKIGKYKIYTYNSIKKIIALSEVNFIIAISGSEAIEIKKNLMSDGVKNITMVEEFRDLLFSRLWSNPIKRNSIVFSNFDGRGYGDNPKYICDKIDKTKYQCIWLVKDENEKMPNGVRKVRYGSLEHYEELSRAKFWIDNMHKNIITKKRSGQIYIQTWHGDGPLKKIEYDSEELPSSYLNMATHDVEMIDYFISGSKFKTEQCRRAFRYNGKILESGNPRNDIFFKNNDYKLVIYPQFKDFKWILFAPTYREKQSNIIEPEKILQAYKKKYGKECIILIREHPSMKIENLKYNYSDRIFNVSEFPDTQLLLAASDILITDYSSIMWDFSLQEKPVILFHPDAVSYSNERQFYLSFNELPYFEAFNMEDVCNYIISLDTELYKYKSKLHVFFDKYESFDYGTASDNVVNIINELSKEM